MLQTNTQESKIEKRRYWKEHIEGWKACGLKQSEYCRRHQLKISRFTYWKRKLAPSSASPISLVQVALPEIFHSPVQCRPSPLRVAIGDKYRVEVDQGFDPVTLKQLILTLGQL
jgi:hypothetical protein